MMRSSGNIAHMGRRGTCRVLVGNPYEKIKLLRFWTLSLPRFTFKKRKDHQEDLVLDGRIILRPILGKQDVWAGLISP
jgi:hypothetical protein